MKAGDGRTARQLRHAVCAALNCRRRKDLVRANILGLGLLLDVDLCREHAEVAYRALHKRFREEFGVDFVDPTRN